MPVNPFPKAINSLSPFPSPQLSLLPPFPPLQLYAHQSANPKCPTACLDLLSVPRNPAAAKCVGTIQSRDGSDPMGQRCCEVERDLGRGESRMGRLGPPPESSGMDGMEGEGGEGREGDSRGWPIGRKKGADQAERHSVEPNCCPRDELIQLGLPDPSHFKPP